MEKIQKAAHNFVTRNNITTLDYQTLIDIFSNLGFEVVKFNINDQDIIKLFDTLNINYTATRKCFTFISDSQRYVFLANHLSSDEYIFMLLHELGHLELGHIFHTSSLTDDIDELAANKFAFEVLHHIDTRKKRQILRKVIICLLVISIVAFTIHKSDNHNNGNTSTSNTQIEIQTSSINENNDKELYYVTATGKKYHKDSCYIIRDKQDLFSGTADELESMGYEPCKICFGDSSGN